MDPNNGKFYKVTVKGGKVEQEEYRPRNENNMNNDSRFYNRNYYQKNYNSFNYKVDMEPEEEVMIIKTKHIVVTFICICTVVSSYIYFILKRKKESALIIGNSVYYPTGKDPLLRQLMMDQKYDPSVIESFTKKL